MPWNGDLLQSSFYIPGAVWRHRPDNPKGPFVQRISIQRLAAAAGICIAIVTLGAFAQKKKKEEINQTLQVPKDLPADVTADTHRFAFYTTPLSGNGLLSEQICDALQELSHYDGGACVMKFYVF